MKKRKFGLALSLALAAGTILGACGKADEKNNANNANEEKNENAFTVAMVTDVGGVDDKSFNQSAWEGLKEFGENNGLKEGKGGYNYLQSKSDADYSTNLNKLSREGFSVVFGVGFLMVEDINTIAQQQKDTNFGIIDGVVEQPNVVSVLFKEQEAAFLAGVAAAKATKSNKIGFIGGMEIPVIERFESGFLAGVQAVNPDIKVNVHYTGAFDKAELGKTTAAQMYSSGIDVIFHAAGGTGNGLFTEAKDLKKKDPAREIWAIGVDSDQSGEGVVDIGGKNHNVILTSAMKGVKHAVVDISEKAKAGDFPGGQTLVYGLAEEGVNLAPINDEVSTKADIEAAVKEWSEKIKLGEVKVPGTKDELKEFKVQ
ncbi:BMP family ABC transporter substrate-binding protein [Cytobacillus depressus]|uniref:BMP family ABC transporter substrate-binding protein n=1 Tax=Cytobacillus depressus TaxID=1602942 RepID=A0A6L3VEG4_9BACI|nr:BMP family protein [Cytobacillus depressus]KAB2337571.1 BMP family ABC transporter substrate-binding protein [Cytobacillus depressus]